MKLQEVLTKTTQFFKEKNFHSPRLDAELLLAHGLGLERIQLYLKFDQPLSEVELTRCRDLVRRRTQGEPIAYILGYRDFFGHRFKVTSATLIPRPETEHLVEEALKWFEDQKLEAPLFADLGTGTGCIAISILKSLPKAKAVMVDISSEALEVAKENARELGVFDRIEFVHLNASDWLDQTSNLGLFDAILSNPPYIAVDDPQVEAMVRKYEPSQALFADNQGLALLFDWVTKALKPLKNPGLMVMEMGSTQAVQMVDKLESLTAYKEVRVIKDLSGHDRLIFGVKKHG